MKSVEFSNVSVDSSSVQSSSTEVDKAKTLETLLLEKNRALQTENTQLKVAHTDLSGQSLCIIDKPLVTSLVSDYVILTNH